MASRTVDTHEDAQVNTQPLRIRGTTVHTPVISWQATNLGNDALHKKAWTGVRIRSNSPLIMLLCKRFLTFTSCRVSLVLVEDPPYILRWRCKVLCGCVCVKSLSLGIVVVTTVDCKQAVITKYSINN